MHSFLSRTATIVSRHLYERESAASSVKRQEEYKQRIEHADDSLIGIGVVTRTLHSAQTLLAQAPAGIRLIAGRLLSPLNEAIQLNARPQATIDPLLRSLFDTTNQHWYRTLGSARSRHRKLGETPEGQELVLVSKGYDFPLADYQVADIVIQERLSNKQIVCGYDRTQAEHEYDNLMTLVELSLRMRGKLPPTPIPTQVLHFTSINGQSPRDYFNGYIDVRKSSRSELLKKRFGTDRIGDLYEQYNLSPAMLEYVQEGLDVRVHQIVGALLFGRGVKRNGDILLRRVFAPNPHAIILYGEALSVKSGVSVDSILRVSFHELFKAYGVNSSPLLPTSPITEHTYSQVMRQMQQQMQERGIDISMNSVFTGRMIELLTLAHVGGYTLCNPDHPENGGLTTMRNVTLAGIAKDADTLTHRESYRNKIGSLEQARLRIGNALARDIYDTIQTILCFNRLFTRNLTTIDDMLDMYIQEVRIISKDPELAEALATFANGFRKNGEFKEYRKRLERIQDRRFSFT